MNWGALQAPAGQWLEAVLGFLYPPACQICGGQRAGPTEGYVCGGCRGRAEGVRWIRAPYCERCGLPFDGAITNRFECSNCRELDLQFSQARAAVVLTDLVRETIHRYKYHGARWFEPFLVGLLVEAAGSKLTRGDWEYVVPVPLHPAKEREREFNQAVPLARALSRTTGIPLNTRLVRRVEYTRTQTRLARRDRVANVRHSFTVAPRIEFDGHRIVLVDDILTTGSTTSACAAALREAGAGEVCVWTVARGL